MTILSLMGRQDGSADDRRGSHRRHADASPAPAGTGPNWPVILAGLVVTLTCAYGATLWLRVDRIDAGVQTHYQVAAAKVVELEQVKRDVTEIKASQEQIRAMIARKSELEAENNQLLRQLVGKRAR
jgi:hypothetical protein